jgi:hypothetical protein
MKPRTVVEVDEQGRVTAVEWPPAERLRMWLELERTIMECRRQARQNQEVDRGQR